MKYLVRIICLFLFVNCLLSVVSAQPFNQKTKFTHQDTLRGSIGPGRAWWNVTSYNIFVEPDYQAKSISGWNEIHFSTTIPGKNKIMQIDLQEPMMIDSVLSGQTARSFKRDGNAYFIDLKDIDFKSLKVSHNVIKIFFHGNPHIAQNPPWGGGWIFGKDEKGRPWMTVACQGLGASVWYPCKDHQSDEPNAGATLSMKVADSLVAVGNGRLKEKVSNKDGTTTWTWQVVNPINNYNIIPYIGKYVTWHEDFPGEKGNLDCDYWVLDYDLEKAQKQFGRDVHLMLKCFEYWFGPYPFYEDGYKLVEASHLGMEHQSAVAYGNHFMNGYLGRDLSGSGWGLKWDYIIVHESGHEWFANNITSNDIADMWVHEGFTDYSETLFVECQEGKEAADAYAIGLRRTIRNNTPIIGSYGVNKEGSGDMYNKGNNLLHTIRQVVDNDDLWRQILRGLNKEFYHKTVDTKDIETYMTKKSGKDLSKIFDQYLRAITIPVLDIRGKDDSITYSWKDCIVGFNMPVKLNNGQWIYPTDKDQSTKLVKGNFESVNADKNFYIKVQKGLPE